MKNGIIKEYFENGNIKSINKINDIRPLQNSMPVLHTLILHDNKITSLKHIQGSMDTIVILILSNNRIKKLHRLVGNIPLVDHLYLFNNRITDPLPFIDTIDVNTMNYLLLYNNPIDDNYKNEVVDRWEEMELTIDNPEWNLDNWLIEESPYLDPWAFYPRLGFVLEQLE